MTKEPVKRKVWIDTDLAVGMKRDARNRDGYSDVDDGYAILQLLQSEKIEVVALSAVFGNTKLENAYQLCQHMSAQYASYELPVYKGAAEAINLEKVESNEAVEALAAALKIEKLTILAIGPATNVGLLLLKYPDLSTQIEEVVLVAGRRTPKDYFLIGNPGRHAWDLNFDLDNDAFRIMFEKKLNITLCPYEISKKVWIKKEDLQSLAQKSTGAKWLSKHSEPWLSQWIELGADGFNPFDVLASHYLSEPEAIISEQLNARLEIHPNDTIDPNPNEAFKQYLICDSKNGFPVKYCFDVVENYHEKLMQTLK
jgi:pyrimidine-specific ribonucleoside hydrolase